MELAASSDKLELAMADDCPPRFMLASGSIVESALRERDGVMVIGIQREDRRMELDPEPDAAIRRGDTLALGRPDSLRRVDTDAAEAAR